LHDILLSFLSLLGAHILASIQSEKQSNNSLNLAVIKASKHLAYVYTSLNSRIISRELMDKLKIFIEKGPMLITALALKYLLYLTCFSLKPSYFAALLSQW